MNSHIQSDTSPSDIKVREAVSPNSRSFLDWWLDVLLLQYRERRRGDSTELCRELVLIVRFTEMSQSCKDSVTQ